MIEHVLERNEIQSIPSGRLMNAMVYEYVMGQHPERRLNLGQKMERTHWFEELPRSCAEDAGDSCPADFIPKYSTDHTTAFTLSREFKNGLETKFVPEDEVYWASFSGVA